MSIYYLPSHNRTVTSYKPKLDFFNCPDDAYNWKRPDGPLNDPSYDDEDGAEGSEGVLLS